MLRIRPGRREKIKRERAKREGRRKEVESLHRRAWQGGGLWGIEIQALVLKLKGSFLPATLAGITDMPPPKKGEPGLREELPYSKRSLP